MADVTSEATLKVTTVGADKAAADLRKVQSGLKDVEGQARRTAGSLKSPVGGGGAGSLAAGRAAHPVAALAGDMIGEAMGAMVKAISNPRARGAVAKAGDAVTKQTIKQSEARAKAVAGSTTRVNSALIKTAGHVANLGKVFDPLVSLLPSAVAGIAGAGTALGILAPAAIAVAGSVFLLTKSFKWISDAAEDALDNLGRARRASQGLNIGAEQERLSAAGTSLGIAVGDKFVKPLEASINKLIGDLRTGDIDAKLQEKLNFFGVTLTRLKEFEDKTGRIDFQKVFGLAVGLREELERNIQAAAGDPAKLAKLQENYSKFHSTFEQAFGKEFIDLVDRTSTNMLKAGQAWAAKLDAALGQMPREEVSKNAEEFQLAINRFGSVWTTLRTNIAEGAMPAATAAINAWANVFLEVAPKIQEIGKTLTIGLWQGVEATSGVLRDFVALLPSWETTLKTMQSLWTDFLAEGGRAWDRAENDWKIAVTVITGAISDLKRDFGNMITEVQQTIAWIDGAITAFFAGLKDTIAGFITGLTKSVPGSGINRNAPTLNPSDELPGLRKQSSFTNEGDTSISGARIQLAAMTGGSGGSDVNAVIDKALIKVDGNLNALIRNVSTGGAGEAGISNASLGGAGGFGGGVGGAGGFGGGFGGAGGAGAAPSAGRIAGVGSHDFGGTSLGLDASAGPATPGAPTGSRLSTSAGARMAGVDPRLQEILHAASSHLPPGYRAEITSGGRSASAPGFHPKGKAIDLQIYDDKGRPIRNRGEDTSGVYTRFAQAASGEQRARYPELTRQFAWGGAFGTSAGNPNEKDLMHFDLGGERGRFTQNRLSSLGVLPGGTFGGRTMAGAGGFPASTIGSVSSSPLAPPNPGAATAGLRNYNFGNLKFSQRSASLYPGVRGPSTNTDQGDRQIVFGSLDEGIRAAGLLAQRKFASGRNTVNKLVAAQGGHTPGNFAAAGNIARSMGVGPNDAIDLNDPATKSRYLRAIAIQEHGKAGAAISAEQIQRALSPRGGSSITGSDVSGNQPIIVPPGTGMNRSAVAAQGPAEGPGRGSFRGSAEGEAFGKSAAENLRKGLEGTNIPVSGIPSASRGVAPHTGPKNTGADTATWDI